MNLSAAELSALPMAAALFNGDDVLAATPEWRGPAPGSLSYRVHSATLVVGGGDAHPLCAQLLTRLLDGIDEVARGLPHRHALRARMVAASLRLVAGRASSTSGSSADVLEYACAGIAARTALTVTVEGDDGFAVLDPAATALVLVQFASNAERHDHAESVSVRADRQTFTVSWVGDSGGPAPTSARRRADRTRWGLGFTRIAADSIGGAVYPPVGSGPARSASFEVGLNRLTLPLALLHDGRVRKATRAWDEETGLLPGTPIPSASVAGRCCEAAASTAGIVHIAGWCARRAGADTWVAIPPDGAADRMRDVLDGLVHERALWDSVPEPGRSRVVALAALLASLLGDELPRVPGAAWNRRATELAGAYGLGITVPSFHGAGAVDPRVVMFLAAECGGSLETEGDDLFMRIPPRHQCSPIVQHLAAGSDFLRLS